jgi:hypothetical protein
VSLDDLDRAVPGLVRTAPKTATSLVSKLNLASAYIASKRPQPLNQPSLIDPNAEPRWSDTDTEQFFETIRATQDPVGTLARALDTGHIGQHEVDAIRAIKLF